MSAERFAINRIAEILDSWIAPGEFCPLCDVPAIEHGHRESGKEFVLDRIEYHHKNDCPYAKLANLIERSPVQIWYVNPPDRIYEAMPNNDY